MRNYEELVRCLRGHSQKMGCADNCICADADKRGFGTCSEELAKLAADAIEELSKQVELEHQSGFADGQIAANRKKPRWIPVMERLPEDGQYVLAYSADDDFTTVEARHRFAVFQITHWMPLPEPPEEG